MIFWMPYFLSAKLIFYMYATMKREILAWTSDLRDNEWLDFLYHNSLVSFGNIINERQTHAGLLNYVFKYYNCFTESHIK